jgi:hypothetical protein
MLCGLLSRPKASIHCALAEADHLIYFSVHESDSRSQIRFHSYTSIGVRISHAHSNRVGLCVAVA